MSARVEIVYGIVANKAIGRGYLPVLWVDGRQHGDTYRLRGFDVDVAWTVAEAEARTYAEKFAGDWTVTIRAASNYSEIPNSSSERA